MTGITEPRARYEYRLVRGSSDDDFEQLLTAAGAEGWRVVGTPIISDGGVSVALLERPLLRTLTPGSDDLTASQILSDQASD